MAKEMLRDLAPLVAEKGIDVDGIDGSDLGAVDRAVDRRSMELFSPVGPTCVIAVATLRLVVGAVVAGDTVLAGTVLARLRPEAPVNAVATVGSCIGVALELLDDWMPG